MTEEDKPLEEITIEEYEDAIEEKLETFANDYNNFAKAYNQYIKDKKRFKIIYYIQDGLLFYTKEIKKKPGFDYKNK